MRLETLVHVTANIAEGEDVECFVVVVIVAIAIAAVVVVIVA